MIEVIHSQERDRLAAKLKRISERNVAFDDELMSQVAAIINDVRRRGDSALIDYASRFDGCDLRAEDLRVSEKSLRVSAGQTSANVLSALRESIRRVRAFHQFERQQSWEFENEDGSRLGQRITPLDAVGLYVPGGTASYPSSVVMNVVPAQIAGVSRIAVATPPGTIQKSPAVAAALLELGVTEVYAAGGAQAIAALAYGTETIPHVNKITGPGNKYVAAAKRLVFGAVGIDAIAGPSEVVIVADDSADASYVASDLLAQAEHGEDASAVLVTTSKRVAAEVAAELSHQARSLPRVRVIEASLAQFGAIVVVGDLDEACELVNDLAPEHVEVVARDQELIASRIRSAGAIFFGEQTPVAAGDYLAGPNHVLPTAGAARFSSALGVADFLKRTSLVRFSPADIKRSVPLIAALAEAEGLEGHAASARIRMKDR
jgi:histidinol dehydrogenase